MPRRDPDFRCRRDLLAAFAGSIALSLIGCAKPPPPPPKPKQLTVEIQAAPNLNPDASGRPSPLVLRVYELKAAGPFEAADFFSLFEKDQSVLGADIVVREEFVLMPGGTRTIQREAGESKFLAVMAAFRDLERARWRAVAPLTLGSDNRLLLRLDGSTVQLTKR